MSEQNVSEQIFPAHVDPSKLKQVSPGHWEDEASGAVFYTGTSFRPPVAQTERVSEPAPAPAADEGAVLEEINKLTDDQLHADAAERKIDGQEAMPREDLIDALLLNAGYKFNHAGETNPE